MFNANNNTNRSVFNEIYYETDPDREPECPSGAWFVTIGDYDYITISYYRDRDIKDIKKNGGAYYSDGWFGVGFYNTNLLSKYNQIFDEEDCKDLCMRILNKCVQKYTKKPIVAQSNSFEINLDRMLSKTEAKKLAQEIDKCIDNFIDSRS